MVPHARPMTLAELRAALRAAWDAIDAAQANLDRATPRISPWVARALAGTLPAPTLAPVVRPLADELSAPRAR